MKDPAFLFYPESFMMGVAFMTDEQVGKYMKLLCLQHSKGHLTIAQLNKFCNDNDQEILDKFQQDDQGKYFNKRLDDEIVKRRSYTKSRLNNFKKKSDLGNHMEDHKGSHMNPHMEDHKDTHMESHTININTNINKDINKDTKKKKYAEFVSMTIEEYEKLIQQFGEIKTKKLIESLDNYKGSKGKKYKSDYRTILVWESKNDKEKQSKGILGEFSQREQTEDEVEDLYFDPFEGAR